MLERVNNKYMYMYMYFDSKVPYFIEFFPPLNYSRTGYLAQAEQNKPRPWIVLTPCACAIILVGMAHTFYCSVVRVAPQHTAYSLLKSLSTCTIAQLYSTVESGWFITITCFMFARAISARSAVHIRAQKCCDINCTPPPLYCSHPRIVSAC